MKKIFTLIASALFAVASFADTPLAIGGGGAWNGGFAGIAETYTFNITSQWGAAEFNINSADYVKAIVEFDGECPAGFQLNYVWKESADAETSTPQYGVAACEGKTSAEIVFNEAHPFITMVSCQHTNADAATLKIKQLTLVDAAGAETKVAPAFTGWAGTDETVYSAGTVSLPSQYMQLQISGATGMKGIEVRVEFAEAFAGGLQFCVDYEDGVGSEWPQMTMGSTTQKVTTKEGATIKNLGIQRQQAGAMEVTVLGAWLVDNTTGISTPININADAPMYNLAGQRVNNAKGIVVKNGKKMLVK